MYNDPKLKYAISQNRFNKKQENNEREYKG